MQTDLALIQEGKSVRREFQRRKLLAIARRVGLAALTLGAAAVAFFTLWRELGRPYDISANHEVTNLIERGFACARSQTPDRLRQAEVDFQKATNLDRTFVPAHWGLFQVAVIRNEWTWDAPESAHQHIRSLAERLKKIAPNGAESHVAAAFIKWMDWKFAEAVAEDRIACRARAACREGRSAAHNVCGWHLLQRGHPEEALLEYREAERLYPSSPIAMHHLGHPYFVQRQFDQALKCYQASIEAETSNSLGHFWKGRVYEETGNFAGALEEFEESLRLSGQNPMSRKNREAVLEASVKDPDRGYWTKQLDLLPTNSPQNYYRIATLYAHLSDTTNAYSYLKKACEKQAFSQGPLFDPCWNKSDTNFQAIVRSIGLLQ
jgi:tetratricopeptide (TPR) repeat protein